VEGEGSVMFGVDGKYIRPEHVLSCFDNRNCPLLAGKPKLFFFQACRGGEFVALFFRYRQALASYDCPVVYSVFVVGEVNCSVL